MAGTGKSSIAAAVIIAGGLAGLTSTAAMAQFPIPMIPNFNFGQQHYRSGSSHYSTSHSHARHEEQKEAPVDKTKEKDATQPPDPTASASTQPRQQQLSGPPRDATAHDAAPSAGPSAAANPPPAQKTNDDPPPDFDARPSR